MNMRKSLGKISFKKKKRRRIMSKKKIPNMELESY